MRIIILIILAITLLSFKSYKDLEDDDMKNFAIGELSDLEFAKNKKNISDLVFRNNFDQNLKFSKFKGNILLINFLEILYND